MAIKVSELLINKLRNTSEMRLIFAIAELGHRFAVLKLFELAYKPNILLHLPLKEEYLASNGVSPDNLSTLDDYLVTEESVKIYELYILKSC